MGDESILYVQKLYEEMRKDTNKFRIVRNTSSPDYLKDLPGFACQSGIYALFGITLPGFVDVQDSLINRVRRAFISNFFFNLLLIVNSFNHGGEATGYDKKLLLWKIDFKEFIEKSDRLVNKLLFVKSKGKEYFDILPFQGLTNGYVHCLGGFEIELSEATFDEIIIMISEAEKEKYFKEAEEITEEEANSISVPREYIEGKPAYREGEVICILEDSCNWRKIDALKYTDDRVHALEDGLQKIVDVLDTTEKQAVSREGLKKVSTLVDNLELYLENQSYMAPQLRSELLNRATELTYKLEMAYKQARLHEIESRLDRASQVVVSWREKIIRLRT